MNSYAHDGRDIVRHFVIQKSISVTFRDPAKPSDKLRVLFEDWDRTETISLDKSGKVDSQTRCWTLGREILVFPGDNLTLQIPMDKGKHPMKLFKKKGNDEPQFDECQIEYDDIKKEFGNGRQLAVSAIPVIKGSYTVSLEVVEGNIERIVDMDSNVALDPLMPKHVEGLIDSAQSLFENAQSLQSVLENIPVTEEACQLLERTVIALGDAHPLVKAIASALTIPFKWLRKEAKYKKELEDVAHAMLLTCKSLMDVRNHTKTTLANDVFKSTLKLLRNAAVFVDVYCRKGRIKQFIGAQFPTRLAKFGEDLIKQKNDFQIAMILQIVRDVDSTALITSDDFLQKRLNPANQDPLGDGCLPNTRKNVLKKIRDWLDNTESDEKILWIVGAPGAGKTTVATSIANELRNRGRPCAKFFVKRDIPDLSDARRIWPSIAYSLADRHDSVKAALMLALRDKRNADVQDDPAFVQFEKFVVGPLNTDTKELGSRPRQNPFPIVIIDALDECYSARNWNSFIKSLASWPRELKLIITSRYHHDLHEKLGDVSYRIDLATGDDASTESRDDMKVFFEAKFKDMKSRSDFKVFELPQVWPTESEIKRMADYAAGLFIWADMAVSYVAPLENDIAGYDPDQRLRNVLSDIGDKDRSGIEGADRVDILYARIIFEAFPRSILNERVRARRTLAFILLAKALVRENDLIELMSTDKWNSHNTVVSALLKLRSIIPSSGKHLRVCHQSVSDFALSSNRISTALSRFVPDESERSSYIINVEEENKHLALACLHLMQRKLSTPDLHKVAEFLARSQSQPDGFSYARRKWLNHLQDADGVYHPLLPDLKSLKGAIEIAYGRLERFTGELKTESYEAVALVENIHGSIELARSCIETFSQGERKGKILQHEVVECAKNLDFARGHFQIAAVLRREVSNYPSVAADHFLRRKLAPSDQSKLDEECVPGTRTDIFSKAKDWLKDPNSPNILWIVGAPGAGKSAIATTLMKEFSSKYICGGFFAKRDIRERRDPTCIWRTLAYELMQSNAGMGGSIMEGLFLDGLINTREQEDYRDLIIKAAGIQQSHPVIVVIDALDECFMDLEGDEPSRKFLRTVADCSKLSQSFKLVITSRDLVDIRCVLLSVSQEIILPTGTETSAEARADTKIFFQSKLAHLPRASYWLSEGVLLELVERASGSFIWAKMFIGLVMLNAGSCLEDIVTGSTPGSTWDIGVLYAKVLVKTLGQLSEKERSTARGILSAIVLAKDPLQRGFLELLPINNVHADDVSRSAKRVFKDLQSIIIVDENLSVRIPHKSFTDFFLDEDWCSKAMGLLDLSDEQCCTYLIRKKDDCATLAIACLNWMKNNLAFNTGRIPTLHMLNERFQNLEAAHMDLSLVYACRYWAKHLRQATRDNSFCARAQPLLRTFFYQKALFWLEILSLAKAVASAKESLRTAKDFLEGYDNDLAVFADDVLEFVTYFEYPITAAASHIYISALPFSPSNSRIFQTYAPQFPNLLSVRSGRREVWGDAPVGGDGHDESVIGVAFFREGSRLASASIDQTVRIWDSKTGKVISRPFKHESAVCCMAVSPDGKLIASGDQGGALLLWDSVTGACKLSLAGAHSAVNRSVAFSPDGSRIVTGSWDMTVKFWDCASGELCLGPLTGHTRWVNSVTFSHDGIFIASGSDDRKIWIWDATTGKPHREPLVGNTSSVLCLAFSADRHYLASGSLDNTIRLWNVIDGFTQTSFIDSGSWVRSISFSRKSETLVSGHDDGSLHFWDVRAGELHQLYNPIYGHTKDVNSIAFSSDELLLASGSNDNSIKIWAVSTLITPEANYAQDENTEKHQYVASDLDQRGHQALGNDCYIDKDGWLWDSHRKDAKVLFWVPEENRAGFWFPRNTAVIHKNVTKIDFSRFVHGEKWVECAKSVESVK